MILAILMIQKRRIRASVGKLCTPLYSFVFLIHLRGCLCTLLVFIRTLFIFLFLLGQLYFSIACSCKQVCIHKISRSPACLCPPRQKHYRWTNRATDQPTDRRTHPLIELWLTTKNKLFEVLLNAKVIIFAIYFDSQLR